MARLYLFIWLTYLGSAAAQDRPSFLDLHAGPVTIHPGGFFEDIAQFRSNPTADSISTRFAGIPLADGSNEWVSSIAHSRLQTKAWSTFGSVRLTAYYEMDFLGNHVPYRTRQFFGELQYEKWHVTGGRAWTLLRPNRWGMESDAGLWNTDVIEPQYHVGIVGARKEQLRISRYDEHWGAAVSLERRTEKTGTDVAFKVMRQFVSNDKHYHLEGGGMASPKRSGFMVSAILPITAKLQFVTQEYYSRKALSEALGIVPTGVNGGSFIQGLELRLTRNLEIYGYGGMVIAGHSNNNGNRHAREVTVGVQRLIPIRSWHGTLRSCLQIARIERDIWSGREGGLTQLFLQLRYDLP